MFVKTDRTCPGGAALFQRAYSDAKWLNDIPPYLFWHAPLQKWLVTPALFNLNLEWNISTACTGAAAFTAVSTTPSSNMSLLDTRTAWTDPGISGVTCGVTTPLPPPPPAPPQPPWPPYGLSVASSASCGAPGVNLIELKARARPRQRALTADVDAEFHPHLAARSYLQNCSATSPFGAAPCGLYAATNRTCFNVTVFAKVAAPAGFVGGFSLWFGQDPYGTRYWTTGARSNECTQAGWGPWIWGAASASLSLLDSATWGGDGGIALCALRHRGPGAAVALAASAAVSAFVVGPRMTSDDSA